MFRIHSSMDFFRIQKFQIRSPVKLNKTLFFLINHLFKEFKIYSILITPIGTWQPHFEELEVKRHRWIAEDRLSHEGRGQALPACPCSTDQLTPLLFARRWQLKERHLSFSNHQQLFGIYHGLGTEDPDLTLVLSELSRLRSEQKGPLAFSFLPAHRSPPHSIPPHTRRFVYLLSREQAQAEKSSPTARETKKHSREAAHGRQDQSDSGSDPLSSLAMRWWENRLTQVAHGFQDLRSNKRNTAALCGAAGRAN